MDRLTDESFTPLLRAALEQTRSATCITTADLDLPGPEIVYVNPAYCRMIGRPSEEVIGRTPRIMQGPLTSRAVLDRLRADLTAGRPFAGETVNYRGDGQPYFISWRIDPVVDEDGEVRHYVATQDDVTRLRRAERLLSAERSIDEGLSSLLSRASDTTTNLTALATDIGRAVSGLNDFGSVAVAGSLRLGTSIASFAVDDDVVSESMLFGGAGPNGSVQRGVDDNGQWIGCSLSSERAGVDGLVVVAGLDEAQAQFVDDASVERVAACARRALESLAEYERQRHTAIELQTDLLPKEMPFLPGLSVRARYWPGAFATRVGGDWYEAFADERRVVLMIGDVAGSGVRAAADMGRLKLLSQVMLEQGTPVETVLGALDRFCADQDLVATALAVTLDIANSALSVVSAGHPPPIMARSGAAHLVQLEPGPLLGVGSDRRYEPLRLHFDEADTWLLFTDGLFEEPTESVDVSLMKLANRVALAPGDLTAMCDELIAERVSGGSADDIALLAFRLDTGR
jgi:PAS domain S-box-containing protein